MVATIQLICAGKAHANEFSTLLQHDVITITQKRLQRIDISLILANVLFKVRW